jgi:hypothetical protein
MKTAFIVIIWFMVTMFAVSLFTGLLTLPNGLANVIGAIGLSGYIVFSMYSRCFTKNPFK